MPDDRRRIPLSAATLLAALCLGGASIASAETLRGYAQVQYQKLENGKTFDRTFDREWWVKSLQVDYAARLRKDLSLNAQAQVTDLSYTGRAEASRVPYGSLRLTHSYFGVYGSYRLQDQTDILGTTTHQKQAVISGYWARQKWPRLDLNWLRRRLDSTDRLPGSTGETRTASMTHDIGPLNLRSGYTDQVQNPDNARARRVSQRTWNGGTSYLYGAPTKSLSVQYDFFDSHRAGAGPTDGVQTHNVNLAGGQKLSPRANLGLNYSFRRTLTRSRIEEAFNDNDGALLLTYIPSPPFTFSTGGGVRTIRTGPGQSAEEYMLASASATGRLRHGWTGGANATYSINWSPSGQPHAINAYGANTLMRLWKGMDASGALQVSINEKATMAPGDSIARPTSGRIVTQTNLGANATPLRGFSWGYTYQLYRAGEGVTGPATTSNSSAWNLNWSPAGNFHIGGNRSSTKGLGPTGPRLVTARADVRWDATRTLQLSGAYARSDQPRHDTSVDYVSGRKLVNLRALAALARDLRASIGMNWVDPGTDRSVRQFDATLTQRFGG